MKKLLGIVVLGLLWCNAGVASGISYICTEDDSNKKDTYVYEIKKRKLYLEGDFQKTKYLKTSSSKAEFRYETMPWGTGTSKLFNFTKLSDAPFC